MRSGTEGLPPGSESSSLFSRLAPARARLAANDERLLSTQIALSEIPAPTGAEEARGASVAERFRALGLRNVRVDDVGNVLGTRDGNTDAVPVVVCAHLDTIFPEGTPVSVSRDGPQLCGPGIVDNSRGLAAMLALAEAIDGRRVRTRRPILFAATVGEEGAGDLRGVKRLFSRLSEPPSACIALDGALLANGGGEEDRAASAHSAPINRLGKGEHGRESARVVHDAGAAELRAIARHTHGCALGKDRIEMGADDDGHRVGVAIACAEHVADVVDADVSKTEGAKPLGDRRTARLLGAGGSGNLREGDLRAEQPLVVCGEAGAGRSESREKRGRLAAWGKPLGAGTHALSMATRQPVAQDTV